MAETAVLLAITKIGIALAGETLKFARPLLAKKFQSVAALPDEMQLIRNQLELIHAFLKGNDRKRGKDEVIDAWIEQVRRLAYNMEDIVDQFIYVVGKHNQKGSWWDNIKKIVKKPQSLFSLDEIAEAVERINKELKQLLESRDLWVKPLVSGSDISEACYETEQELYLPGHDYSINDEELGGNDKNKQTLIDSLHFEDPSLRIIAVWGMGGIGKSTLVNNVYKNEVSKFDCHAWVSISQSYKLDDVWKKMLRDLLAKDKKEFDPENMSSEELRVELTKILDKKQYLIVLDDVWTAEVLFKIRKVLVDNGLGSRVIITTRFEEIVAENDCKIKLESLNDHDAWLLFCKKAFPKVENHICPPDLHQCGKDIVEKCDGLPLALVAIGSILSLQTKSVKEWSLFYNQLIWELHSNENLNHVGKILNLSYKYLPDYLKNCFLYCAMFPEDYLIYRKRLIRLWIAEGFIEQKGACSLEDIAEGYLGELVRRSMLQVVMRNSFDRIKCLRMHDLVREIAIFQSTKESFSTTYDDNHGVIQAGLDSRRLSVVQCSKGIPSIIDPSRLRTIIAFDTSMALSSWYSSIPSQSKYLAVLDLSGLPIEAIPNSVGELFNLRLLCLNDTNVKELPKSITKLRNLQTLSLARSQFLSFPPWFSELTKLRYLYAWRLLDVTYSSLRSWECMEPFKGLWNLNELQNLASIKASEVFVAKLGNLSQLRSLSISDVTSRHCAQLCVSLSKMRQLTRLYIGASNEDEVLQLDNLTFPNRLQKLFLWGQFSEGTLESPFFLTHGNALLEISLGHCQLTENQLSRLSELSGLTQLYLSKAYTGQQLHFTAGWSRNLKNIILKDLPQVNQICIHEGALINLEYLRIQNLQELRDFPIGVDCLTSLKTASFIDIRSDFARNLRRAKLHHIPNVYLKIKAKQSGGQERDGNNIVLEETSSNISTLVDALIEDVGEVREMGDPISASLGAKRPLITEASAECAVEQSGAQDRDRNNTVLEKSRILTSSNISTLLDGSVSASLGAMRALVGKLDMLLIAPRQVCSSESVKDGMQLLREDVEEISSFLDKLSEVEEPPPTAKCWMNDALDLSCDIEDYIDGLLFVQPAEPSRLSSNIKSTRSGLKLSSHAKAPKRLKPRHEQIAERVSEFSMFIQKAIERHQRYDLHSCSALRRRFMPLGPMLPMRYEETAVTVIDGRMNKFINSLANDDGKQIKVMSVLGCSGLGKTTLARALYNEVGKRFQYRAFIRVSEQPDTRRIFRDMLFQLERRHPTPDCKETDLIDNINTYLQDKRYLIILDDVWDASVWDIINHAFPKGSHGSRIITTTQVEDVALTCCCYQSEHIFQMKPLDGDHSRKLFFNILFGSESNCPEQFKGDLNKIVEICGGLPLVTISIASLIASQPAMTKDVLKHIHESLSSPFLEKSISERTRQALNLSFNNLPQYLKSCLLYLSMCPEGYEFFKYDLVKQWVAEGLIDITEGQDITKVAESYLDQLIGRRFIQPISISYNNEVVSCAVHDAIHDFIVHKSAEENFIVAINHSQNKVSLSHMVRRLSLLFGDARYAKTPANISKPQIRSLRFSGLFECMPCIRDFKLLRVLNLHLSGNPGDHDSIDLTRISELFLLRYLKIACDFCIELPKAMGELRCLETLDLMDATRVTAFPWDIIHLPHLLHLALPVERNLLDWIGSMGDSIISLWNLGKLNNLHDLHLTSSCTQPLSDHLERSMEALGALLGGHGNLKTLALTHDDRSWYKDASRVIIFWDGLTPPPLLQRFEFSPHSCITFSRVPQWVKELGNLCILKITVRELQMHCVDILRGLPALTALSLYVETSPIDEIIFGNHGFSVLKYFKFRCSAPWLKFEAGAMPTLGKLMLGFNAIPAMDQHQHGNALISIEHMPGLKEISAKIGGVTANNADAISALRTIVSNHQNNPTINVQLVHFTFYGHESTKQKQQPDEVVGLPVGETN